MTSLISTSHYTRKLSQRLPTRRSEMVTIVVAVAAYIILSFVSLSGDVILTYSYSKLVEKALLDAAEAGKKIKVIVADGRLHSLGRGLASKLVAAGVHTTYILITAVSQVLPSVSKVLLGCDGVMANGCVLATVGTSQVSVTAGVKPFAMFTLTLSGRFTGKELQQAGNILQ